MIITDGHSGLSAAVDNHNHLQVHAVSEVAIAEASEKHGDAYAWTASADIDATDSILWLRNDSTTQNLIVDTISVSSDAAGSWFIYCPVNATPDGTTVVGVNLNRASSKLALATCKRDNTTASLANYIFYGHNQAAQTAVVQLRGAVVLGYLDCVAIDITTEPALAQATILGYFHPAD